MTSFAAAVISYNTRDLIRDCLKTVWVNRPAEMLVVDNGSTDGSIEMVRSEFPMVKLLQNPQNPGYGAAANQAAAGSQSPYLLILNSDTLLPPDALERLGSYLDEHAGVGLVGPRLLNGDGSLQPSTFPYPTPIDVFLDASHLARTARWLPGIGEKSLRSWSHDSPRRVPWVSGAVLAIRREAFEQVNGFDPAFFMYYEEVDLCYRMAQMGWQIHFAPVTEIVHLGGASTKQRRADMAIEFYKSLGGFYRKHYSKTRQYVLMILLSGIAVGRFLRESLLLPFIGDKTERGRLAELRRAWHFILTSRFRSHLLHGSFSKAAANPLSGSRN